MKYGSAQRGASTVTAPAGLTVKASDRRRLVLVMAYEISVFMVLFGIELFHFAGTESTASE